MSNIRMRRVIRILMLITLGKRSAILSGILLAAASVSSIAAQTEVGASRDSCKAFVQDFYSWYVPKTLTLGGAPLQLALKERRSQFSPELVKGIEEVDTYASRNREAGLDFDPILNTNGEDGEYVVGQTTVEHNVCHIGILRRQPGRKPERVVNTELNFHQGRWFFVNFHYPRSPSPQSENLLSMIKAYLDLTRESGNKPH